MLKVCGITYDHTVNYGSCLQAYALQTAVEGISVFGESCHYELIPFIKTIEKDELGSLKSRVIYAAYLYYRRPFIEFEERMQFAKCINISDLDKLNSCFDAFVCGSDVIWSPEFNHHCSQFYLSFAKKYHFSYAASFGKAEYIEGSLRNYLDCFSRFNQISLREQSGESIVQKYVNCPVKVVADPVLLLDRAKWSAIINQPLKRKCIFVYTTYPSRKIEETVQKLQKATGLPVIRAVFPYGKRVMLVNMLKKMHTPQGWLQLIRDSEYVVTNSFHGTVFSTIFQKRFFSVVEGDAREGRNYRLYEYLNQLGLNDRLFSNVPESVDLGEIDYQFAEKRINQMREASLQFIRENLEEAAKQRSNV